MTSTTDKEVVLAIDIGSSSIRCMAYEIIDSMTQEVEAILGCASTAKLHVVDPSSREGRIRLEIVPSLSSSSSSFTDSSSSSSNNNNKAETEIGQKEGGESTCKMTTESTGIGNDTVVDNNNDDASKHNTEMASRSLLDVVDDQVDEVLRRLRQRFGSPSSSTSFCVVGVGFSSLAMNLVGVDHMGQVCDACTISYACNSPQVAEQCEILRQKLGPDGLDDLYQRTGTPLHSSYALPQLRALYLHQSESMELHQIVVWQTLAGLCMSRWRGTPFSHISYSEASWTGLLNFRTCEWDPVAVQLLPEACQRHLPPLADYSDVIVPSGDIQDCWVKETSIEKNPYWDRWPELRGAGTMSNHNSTSSIGARRISFMLESLDRNKDNTGDDQDSSCNAGDLNADKKNHVPSLHDSSMIESDSNTDLTIQQSPHHCHLFLGLGDGACANVGSKCTNPTRIAVTIGTSAAARVCLPLAAISIEEYDADANSRDRKDNELAFRVPKGLFCYRLDRSYVILGGALTDGGSVVEWARSIMNLKSNSGFTNCLQGASVLLQQDYQRAAADGNTNTLTVLPFLSGERSTGFRSGASFGMMGFSRATSTPAHVLKACLEGVVLRLNAILRLLRNEILRIQRQKSLSSADAADQDLQLIVSGAALERNTLWRQMLADCTGMQVVLDTSITEGTSRGAARMVAMAGALREEEAGSLNGSPSSSTYQYLSNPEPIVNLKISQPVRSATENYWMAANENQENIIDAISPLW